MAATTNGTKHASKVVSPTKLAHVVLRTNNLEKMLEFYCTFLGGQIVHKTDVLSFMTYDDEHHRIAFIQTPHCQDKIKNSNGLEVRDSSIQPLASTSAVGLLLGYYFLISQHVRASCCND